MTHKTIPASAYFRRLANFASIPDSWSKQLDLIRNDSLQPYFFVAFTLWLVGVVEIIQKTTGQRLDPRFWMLVAVLITAYSGVRIFRLTPPIVNRRHSVPSPAAKEMVDAMVSNGLAVYHATGDGYVVVGHGGVYAMEVKSTNVFGSGTIEFRKENELVLGGRIADSRLVSQAQAAAQKIRQRLQTVLQLRTAVKPLIVFLNDWRINQPDTGRDVAVVSANHVQQYFDRQQQTLTESELANISTCFADPAFAVAC